MIINTLSSGFNFLQTENAAFPSAYSYNLLVAQQAFRPAGKNSVY